MMSQPVVATLHPVPNAKSLVCWKRATALAMDMLPRLTTSIWQCAPNEFQLLPV